MTRRAVYRMVPDFVCDTLANGHRFRRLNVVDDFSGECLAIEVDFGLPRRRVTRVLERLVCSMGRQIALSGTTDQS